MGFIYVDESKHPALGFAVIAVLYSETSLEKDVEVILLANGLNPTLEEYKSGLSISKKPELANIRSDFASLTFTKSCKIAFVVTGDP